MDKLPKDVKLITNKSTQREFFNYCKCDVGKILCEKGNLVKTDGEDTFLRIYYTNNAERENSYFSSRIS